MNNDRDKEASEILVDEAAGESDFKLEEQKAAPPRNHPHLILIRPNERAAEQDLHNDPPGWPDF